MTPSFVSEDTDFHFRRNASLIGLRTETDAENLLFKQLEGFFKHLHEDILTEFCLGILFSVTLFCCQGYSSVRKIARDKNSWKVPTVVLKRKVVGYAHTVAKWKNHTPISRARAKKKRKKERKKDVFSVLSSRWVHNEMVLLLWLFTTSFTARDFIKC